MEADPDECPPARSDPPVQGRTWFVVTKTRRAIGPPHAPVRGARGQGLAEYALAAGVLAGLGVAVLALFQQSLGVAIQALVRAVNG
jgi:hypothetical protein